jgi:hypothetical protein
VHRGAVAAMRKLSLPVATPLPDPVAERARASHDQAIRELQQLPASALTVLSRVTLPDGVGVQIPHGLGRKPLAYWIGPPDGASAAGVIQDYRSLTPSGAPNNLSQTLSLRAISFGRDIVVDIVVL